ncbi:MAG: hypothetical protein ABSG60_17035 [Terracidiphilus sp.]
MKAYWSETRPNGKPVEPGNVCWIIDLEDGSALNATYGASMEEVLQKLAVQNANAQIALVRRAAAPIQPAAPGTPPPAAPRTSLSADERMQATLDLSNPAKSGEAVIRLVVDQTGVDPRQQAIQIFANLCMAWQAEHPEFYPHAGNKRMLCESAGRKVGGKVGLITKQMLTETFQELQQRGELFEEPQTLTITPPVLPGESQVQHVERPRGTRFATGARSSSFSAPQTAQTRTVKYTEEEIRTMPEAKMRRLIEANDPDYAAACEFHFPQQRTA